MAYVDYEFYQKSFFGNVVPEPDFMRMSERASDFIDSLTFDRLADGLPSDDRQQKRIKKAVCSLAELMYQIELAEKNAINQASASATDTNAGGKSTGRFTPAHAGNTTTEADIVVPSKVHPRSRGEYARFRCKLSGIQGSPPLTRGILFI